MSDFSYKFKGFTFFLELTSENELSNKNKPLECSLIKISRYIPILYNNTITIPDKISYKGLGSELNVYITTITSGSFNNLSVNTKNSIKKINIPNTVKRIKRYSFCDFLNLEEINFYGSPIDKYNVGHIDSEAFSTIPKLKYITIPKHFSIFGNNFIMNCQKLKHVIIEQKHITLENMYYLHTNFPRCYNLNLIYMNNIVYIRENDLWKIKCK